MLRPRPTDDAERRRVRVTSDPLRRPCRTGAVVGPLPRLAVHRQVPQRARRDGRRAGAPRRGDSRRAARGRGVRDVCHLRQRIRPPPDGVRRRIRRVPHPELRASGPARPRHRHRRQPGQWLRLVASAAGGGVQRRSRPQPRRNAGLDAPRPRPRIRPVGGGAVLPVRQPRRRPPPAVAGRAGPGPIRRRRPRRRRGPDQRGAHNLGASPLTERQRRKLGQLYDADVRSLDRRVGEFLSLLECEGLLEDSLVALVRTTARTSGSSGLSATSTASTTA